MRNTITLNGISSDTITGLLIQELPAIVKPAMRTTIEEIDGRDGDIVTELGYSAYDKEITIGLYGSFDINAVIAYFATEGTVVFSNEPDKFYRYKIIDQIDYERLVRYRTATVKLHCQPFKYPTSETPVQLGSGQTVTAEGTDLTMQGTALAPFVEITPKGDTNQTTYTGKNLFNSFAENSDLITVDTDGTILISGNASSGGYCTMGRKLSELAPTLEEGDEVYLYYESDWEARPYMYIGASWNNGETKTITQAMLNTTVIVYGGYQTTSHIKIMMTKTEDTDYEPYVGGTASPNPDYPQEIKMVTGKQTVNITGKNIFNKMDTSNIYQGYFDGTSANPTIIYNTGNRNRIVWVKCKPSTAYSVSFKNLDDFNNPQIGTIDEAIEAGLPVTSLGALSTSTLKRENVMTPATAEYMVIRFQTKKTTININNALPQALDGLQIEESTTATEYESYQDERILLGLHGKNIFDKNDLTMRLDGEYINTNENRLDSSANARCVFVQIEGGKTYTVSKVATTYGNFRIAASIDKPAWRVSLYNIQSASGSATSLTITTPENCKYLVVWWGRVDYQPSEQEVLDSIQIEEGSSATTYEAYTPVELCKIGTYQDYFYKENGNWYLHKEINKTTLPTSGYSRWATHADACMFYKNGALSDALFQTGAITAVIENLTVRPQVANMTEYYDTYAQVNKYGFVLKTDTPGIMVQNKNYSTLADFHTWISENPVEVRYVLANATNTQITDTELIEQLEALKSANSYRDTTHIDTTSDGNNLPVIIAATATGKADGTVTNAGNTYAKPKLTIYGTGTIGIYLNGNQMFQIELGSEGHITIDTEKMEAYKDSESNLKNRLVTGDYSKFRLEAGANQINFSGNINKCVVENYTRWL